jgi:hypothetical protein
VKSVKAGNDPGYTLTEAMLVVTILSIVVGLGGTLMIQAQRYIRLNLARNEIQRESRATLSNINRELRQALASTVVVDQATGQPPQSRITFQRYKPDGSLETVSYYQQGRKLYLKTGSASTGKPVGMPLRFLAFTYPQTDNDGIVSVSLTYESSTYEGGTKALQMAVEKVRIMNP